MMHVKILNQKDYVISRWTGGETTQVMLYPPSGDYARREFLWRVSTATIEVEESTFSELDGYMRYLMLFEGELLIQHPSRGEGKNVQLKPYQVYSFDGGLDTVSKGFARDFNLMVGSRGNGNMVPLQLKKGETLQVDLEKMQGGKQSVLIYAYKGEVALQQEEKWDIIRSGQTGFIENLTDVTSILLKNESEFDFSGAMVQISYE